MHAAPKISESHLVSLRRRVAAGMLIIFAAALSLPAQTPTQSSARIPASPPADQGPPQGSPPFAIVPIDNATPGAALTVAGPLQTWNGRAFITSTGSVTAGTGTAQVALPYRGTLRVCPSTTVKLSIDTSVPPSDVPGLLLALDAGALEASFAMVKSSDVVLTPNFRILIGGPGAAEVKVRLAEGGDTCVDNAAGDDSYVVVSSVFDGGVYRVQSGQRVMFEHGSLQSVVDEEKESCGCPPPAKKEPNEFPLAQSEGLAPTTKAAPAPANPGNTQAAQVAPLAYNGVGNAAETAAPSQPPATPPAVATPNPPQSPSETKKKSFFGKIGHFFKVIFGAE